MDLPAALGSIGRAIRVSSGSTILTAARADATPTPTTLQTAVREAADTLRTTPRDRKLYRVLERTYLEPAATQEAAAEVLGLPFSTYRYQLSSALMRVTEWLWRCEMEGGTQ
jgi:hypothetical protein